MRVSIPLIETAFRLPGNGRPQTARLAQDPHPLPGRRLRSNLPRGGIDEQTLEVRAVEITGSNTGDAPMLPHLFNQIPRDQEIGSVTADGAYDTRRCHNAIHCSAAHVHMHERADRGAAAVIPPRRNAQPWKPTTAGAIARNDALRASKYLGRALWRNWSGYHRRSRVETTLSGSCYA